VEVIPLFELEPEVESPSASTRRYGPWLTVELNRKGVLDIDAVKGCADGMAAYPDGGCYGECYAARTANRFGIDFTQSVKRQLHTQWHKSTLTRMMGESGLSWYRVGTAGDPSFSWSHTIQIIRRLWFMEMTPVIVTKCWREPTDEQLDKLRQAGAVVNISVSGMDTDIELEHRLAQRKRFMQAGIWTIARVVTCAFGPSEWARTCAEKQAYLMSLNSVIDNPLRPSVSNWRVLEGDIITTHRSDSVGGGKVVSLHSASAYLGKCEGCPDQCGLEGGIMARKKEDAPSLFEDSIEFKYVPQVIGSGYEEDVAKLALEDGIAHRAARKNMQIHSAVICLVNDGFAGFFTFQNNHEAREFCLLQSVISPEHHTAERYHAMAEAVMAQNTEGYPAIMTTDPKSKFETPALFESLGFKTYLKRSGFCYMTTVSDDRTRRKLLGQITMVNCWQTTGADWLRLKREWKEKIEEAGKTQGIENPSYATREGCWQGEAGFANVVTGHHHNHNASVLDPVACEIIIQYLIPTEGRRIYNPFGGGVQFGFVAGSLGYEYLASEIRKNQCDANNAICADFKSVKWVKADSSTYEPEGMFDLVFSCPPYYRVEKYVDYDGTPPDGEINHLDTYEDFRDTLFAGYRVAIDHLNENCFFVVMTGDSRDNKGSYRCHEAETELFMRDNGLLVYNKIVYLESAFTRLAQAKKTLHHRKWPKCEQKIIIGYKGDDQKKITTLYPNIGRLS
jgi:hypothetical protein